MLPRMSPALRRRCWCAAVVVSLFAAGCREDRPVPPPAALAPGPASPAPGGTLVLAAAEDLRTLDPALAFDSVSIAVAGLLFDTLLDYAPADAPDPTALVPSLAAAWSVSPDGRLYTFDLREDARFADGSPVLAEDCAYALDRLLAPETASPAAQLFRGIAGAGDRIDGKADRVRGLAAPGPRRLELRLDEPDASFPLLLALTASTPLKRGRGPELGNGPFVVRAFRPGRAIDLARSPAPRSAPARLDAITIELGVPRETMLLSFLRGDVDVLDDAAADDALLLASSPGWAPYVERTPLIQTATELLNVRHAPFDDRRVRQAFNYAVDKGDTVRLAGGRALPANGFLPPRMPGHDPARPLYPHDPAKARRLLAEAGLAGGFEVTYTTLRDDLLQKLAQSIQADLAEVGVRVNIETLTFPAYLDAISRGRLTFAYSSWYMDFPDPRDFLEVKYHARMIGGGTNETGYDNAEVNRLLDAARVEQDRSRRLSLYRRTEDLIYEDCPSVWHYFPVALDVRQPHVMGLRRHPVRGLSYRDAWIGDPRRRAR
jgi:peptide/nickel transport system substrate-binding protein